VIFGDHRSRVGAQPIDALLDDPAMLSEVTATNRQIHSLASVLNSPSIAEAMMKHQQDI